MNIDINNNIEELKISELLDTDKKFIFLKRH